MSQSCTTPQCERASQVLCDHCKQNLCGQHLNEHNNSIDFATEKLDQQQEKILYIIQSKMSKFVHEQEAARDDIDTLTSTIH
ncbi:unnamed protein product [Rotaria sordida]|uniref:Uncharacterized protein n=1 Tax=Rotaria sordida TaxID=392033 RepID=A0A818RNE5_9BILA|nr:unnamed protein product [Rotaria sordida]